MLKGVTIGRGSVIGSGSVVVKDVEPNSVYSGVTARKITTLSSFNVYIDSFADVQFFIYFISDETVKMIPIFAC